MSCPVCLEDFGSLCGSVIVGECGHVLCAQCIARLYSEWSMGAPSRERAALSLSARYNALAVKTPPQYNRSVCMIAFACPSCPADAVSAAPLGWISEEALSNALSQLGVEAAPPAGRAVSALSRATLFSLLLVDADYEPLVCPHDGCGALLAAPRSTNMSTEPTAGRPRDCGHCGHTLCLDCGVPWTATVTDAAGNEANLSHSNFSTCGVFAEELAFRSEVLPTGTKQCPGCMKVVTRLRDDACHNVTCQVCTMHFCIVCLTPSIFFGVEQHLCPHDCGQNACDCDYDPVQRPETADERAARLAAQARGIAEWRRANPKWGGPVTAASMGARRIAKAVRTQELHASTDDGDSGDEAPLDDDAPHQARVYRALRRIEEDSRRSFFSPAAAARAFHDGDGCTLKDQLDRSLRPAELLGFLNAHADEVSPDVSPGGLSEMRAQVLTNVCAMLSSSPSTHRALHPTRASTLLSNWGGHFFGQGATDTVSIARAWALLYKKIGLMLVNKRLARETLLAVALVFSAVPNDALLQWLDDGLSKVAAAEEKSGALLAETWLASVLHFLPPLLALRASTTAEKAKDVCEKGVHAPLILRLERFAALASGRPDLGSIVLKELTLAFSGSGSARAILHEATGLFAPTLIADRSALIDLMVATAREDAWAVATSLAERLRVALAKYPLTQAELLAEVGGGETLLSLAFASRTYERSVLGFSDTKAAFPQVGKDGFADTVAQFIDRDGDALPKIFGWEEE